MARAVETKPKQKNEDYRDLASFSLKIFSEEQINKSICEYLGHGITADVYRLHGDFRGKAVAKVFKHDVPLDVALKEVKMNEAVNNVLKDSTNPVNIPKLLDTGFFEGKPTIIFDYINGQTIKHAWLNSVITPEDGARKWAQVAASFHNNTITKDLVSYFPSQINEYKKRIENSKGITPDIQSITLNILNSMPNNKLCHGDLHPGNVIDSKNGPVAVDIAEAKVGSSLLEVAEFLNKLDKSAELGDSSNVPPEVIRLIYNKFSENYIDFTNYNLASNDLLKARLVVIASHFERPFKDKKVKSYYKKALNTLLNQI